jgi:uncharacterized protein YfdQ (DUF2303 family)
MGELDRTIMRLTDGQLRTFAVSADYPLQDAATELLALRKRVRKLEEALEDFVKWSGSYPTEIFVEPDFEKAHALLQAGGMTLDAISASVLRIATKEMGKRARAVLEEPQ